MVSVPKKKSGGKGVAELEDSVKQLQADYENSVKRSEKERETAKEQVKMECVAKMLPVLDSLDAAIGQKDECEGKGLVKLREQAIAAMSGLGLKEMECVGKQFDLGLQDAMQTGKDKSKEDGIVLEQMQKGYFLNGKVLRHAKVKINKLG